MSTIDIYFLGMVVSLIIIFIIDIMDASKGIVNKFDKKEDIITLCLFILTSWGSLIILSLILIKIWIKK